MLLRRLKLPFISVAPDVDETSLENEAVEHLVLRLSEWKARALIPQFPDAILIGSDQVGILEGKILTKPLNFENAVAQLEFMSGKKVQFLTGLCVLDSGTEKLKLTLEKYDVQFKVLTKKQIENYLHKEQPFHCAGSCMLEGLGIALLDSLSGRDYTALIGLPLIALTEMLEDFGLSPLNE